MNWIVYSLLAIAFLGVSDLFRKLGSGLSTATFANLIFQLGSFLTAIILFLSNGKIDNNPRNILYAFIGGILISIFSTYSMKALHVGPLSIVMPAMRIGGVILVAILGIIILKEKLTLQTFFGLIFSAIGIYLLFSNK